MNLLRRLSIAALAWALAPAALALDLPTLIARVSPAVVVVSSDDGQRASGFVLSRDGAVVTNLHVVAHMPRPRVTLADGRTFDDVAVVGFDPDRDLAVLKIPARNLPTLALGAAGQVKVGQRVVAFGAPWGLSGTATNGIVSAVRRHHRVPKATLLQTDAPLNPGNSGGPLVNLEGQVVGVVVSLIQNAQSLGFAVPAGELRAVLKWSGLAAGPGGPNGCATSFRCAPKESIDVATLRERLLFGDWGPSLLARRWRADGDFYLGASASLYALEGKEGAIRLEQLRPDGEAWLGRKLVVSLVRGEEGYAGESSGEVQCETVRAARKVAWRQPKARIDALGLDRIELSFLAPAPPDPQGDCTLEFRPHRVTLVPAAEGDAPPPTGEGERVESIRQQRTAYLQRRERLRRDCPEVRAKLARDCIERTAWNAPSCTTYDDLAAVCAREGL